MSNRKNPPKPTQYEHPSYGMICFSRSMNSNTERLFGSALKNHHSTIRMTLHPGSWEHDLHMDRYFASTQRLIEIEMSSAQFAEAITSLNMGGGVPCTIRFFNGWVDEPPDVETEVERVKSRFKGDLDDMCVVMKERRAEIEKLTSKLSEKAKEQLRVALDVMIQQLTSNIPFIMEQFNEASDKVVTSAKQEIEAFAMHALRTAGLEALAEGRMPKQLAESAEANDKEKA